MKAFLILIILTGISCTGPQVKTSDAKIFDAVQDSAKRIEDPEQRSKFLSDSLQACSDQIKLNNLNEERLYKKLAEKDKIIEQKDAKILEMSERAIDEAGSVADKDKRDNYFWLMMAGIVLLLASLFATLKMTGKI